MLHHTSNPMPQSISILLRICAMVALIWLVYYLRNVLLPFAVAFMLAYLLNPAVTKVQKLVHKRWIAVLLTLATTFFAIFAVAALVVPNFLTEARHLYTIITERDMSSEWQEALPQFLVDYINSTISSDNVANFFASDNLLSMLDTAISALLPQLSSFVTKTYSLIASILGGMIILLYLIFIMIDYDEINKRVTNLIPARYRKRFLQFFNRFTSEMQKYFRGQILIVLIVSVAYSLGFGLTGLPLGYVFGIIVGMLNIVPYLQIASFPPALALCFLQHLEYNTPLWQSIITTTLVYVAVQVVQDSILTPKIMGRATGLNPALILLSLSVWGKLLGFLGLIVAIPFTCLVMVYYKEYRTKVDGTETPTS